MIDRERQIASVFAIAVGFGLLLVVPNLIPETPQTIEHSELHIPTQLCEDVKLRHPGGMSFNLALVCVNEQFETVMNANHLTEEKYNELIQPVLDSLHTEAGKLGWGVNGYFND